MREYGFELALCAHLERSRGGVLARQLGAGVRAPGNRIVDVVHVAPGAAFAERVALTPESIPGAAIESDVGPGRARYWKDAVPGHPAAARRATERAVDVGFFERERRGGRTYVRQVARYPDWVGGLLGVENKPDLGAPGDLATQLRKDVSLGLFDAVVLATGSHVTGAHRNRLPEEVGIWRVRREESDEHRGHDVEGGREDEADAPTPSVPGVTVEVVREPTPLGVDEPGVELLDASPGRVDVAVVDAAEKAAARRRLAERAYGKGWRTWAMPACTAARPATVDGAAGLPYCAWKGRLVDPANCGPSCPGHDPAPAPAVDHDAERAARTPWDPDPPGAARRQAGLDRFD